MTREEILEVINDIIEEEHGLEVAENDSLLDAELDSFATLMLFAELDSKFNAFPKDTFKLLDIYDISIKGIIDIIEAKLNESN